MKFTIYLMVICFSFSFNIISWAEGDSLTISPPPIPYPVFKSGVKDVKVDADYVSMEGSGLSLTGIGGNYNLRQIPHSPKAALDSSVGMFIMSGDLDSNGVDGDLTVLSFNFHVGLEYLMITNDKYSLIGFGGVSLPMYFSTFSLIAPGIDIESTTIGISYGIPFGLQAGFYLSPKWTFAPFVAMNYVIGGSVSTTTTTTSTILGNSITTTSDDEQSIDSYISRSFGIDFIYEPYHITVGGALQIADTGGDSGDIKTRRIHVSWKKSF